jgi:hypothetical protein
MLALDVGKPGADDQDRPDEGDDAEHDIRAFDPQRLLLQVGLVGIRCLHRRTCAGVRLMPEKMNLVPTSAAVIEPSGLKAWEKFSRRSEERGSPSWAMKGFDAVSRKARPLAITKERARKNG